MFLKDKYTDILNALGACKLIAVSKTKPLPDLIEAYEAGCRDFGENKVQEMVDKQSQMPQDTRWHLIGHLQTNKVKYIAPFIHLIHSVDSLKLLQEINKQAMKNNRVIACLLQIYIAQEETKFGLDFDEVKEILDSEELKILQNIKIVGFMGMASFTENTEQIKKEFSGLKKFYDECKTSYKQDNVDIQELSMGMSGDYALAVQEGSTMVRVGSLLFGTRN
ncbi:alanine racemase [bacterium 336/3]|nr:alanine racemase [bacterium 336/3]